MRLDPVVQATGGWPGFRLDLWVPQPSRCVCERVGDLRLVSWAKNRGPLRQVQDDIQKQIPRLLAPLVARDGNLED